MNIEDFDALMEVAHEGDEAARNLLFSLPAEYRSKHWEDMEKWNNPYFVKAVDLQAPPVEAKRTNAISADYHQHNERYTPSWAPLLVMCVLVSLITFLIVKGLIYFAKSIPYAIEQFTAMNHILLAVMASLLYKYYYVLFVVGDPAWIAASITFWGLLAVLLERKHCPMYKLKMFLITEVIIFIEAIIRRRNYESFKAAVKAGKITAEDFASKAKQVVK